jgi:deoxyribodipyrimidine photo-lyase
MFLTKDLMQDWKLGEQYFARMLVDYDPASNSGGWQGIEMQPNFRVFSPVLQAQRFDNDTEFIKKWIPELKDIPPKDIINWESSWTKYPECKYPQPIVIHKEQLLKLKSSNP